MTAEHIEGFFLNAINGAVPANTPFPAFKFLSPSLAEFADYLPDPKLYQPLSHIDSRMGDLPRRYALPLDSVEDASWRLVNSVLCGKPIMGAIARRLGINPAEYAEGLFPRAALIRDLPGYFIRIHPDAPMKVATFQLYLAADDRAPEMGLRFYSDQGAQIDYVAYLPGRGYFFRRAENSFHGVNQTTETTGIRNSLMLILFRGNKGGFV